MKKVKEMQKKKKKNLKSLRLVHLNLNALMLRM